MLTRRFSLLDASTFSSSCSRQARPLWQSPFSCQTSNLLYFQCSYVICTMMALIWVFFFFFFFHLIGFSPPSIRYTDTLKYIDDEDASYLFTLARQFQVKNLLLCRSLLNRNHASDFHRLPSLAGDLFKVLNRREFSDVTFLVDGKEVRLFTNNIIAYSFSHCSSSTQVRRCSRAAPFTLAPCSVVPGKNLVRVASKCLT